MKGGNRNGIRFLPYSKTWQEAKHKKAYTKIKKTPSSKKTVIFSSPFARLILGKCGGC